MLKPSEAMLAGRKQVSGQSIGCLYDEDTDCACAIGCMYIGYGESKMLLDVPGHDTPWAVHMAVHDAVNKYRMHYGYQVAEDNDENGLTIEQIAARLAKIGY